jgi:hypothetical protein
MSELPASEHHDPVKIKEEDRSKVVEIQELVGSLNNHRQEMGRVQQALYNLLEATNAVERDLADKRRALAGEYNLENYGLGQWALDFEKAEFVRLDSNTPVIP